ncbi:hypothetical protein C4D60_Mb04t35020 [Musa balbisiana]|uniref:Peptidase M16 N-terminal domain-containing protein n=1 Tax=Musa balbisiana TaxID=52838 RepID=A0A4S8KH26_MUSBA|nr:hypothetical protein C4D60_Mb04t35020 [Musa balbisiana]
MEHMIFKGTESRTVRQLEEEIENMGGHLNAYTSREQTTYYAKVLDKDVPKALEILADILQNSCFDDKRIERERDVILREMKEVEGQTEKVIFDHLHATAFQYTPLGRTILGPAQNIKTITKEHLKNYISTLYTAARVVISAAGAVKHEDIVDQVKKLFRNLSNDPTTASQLVAKEPAIFTGSEVRIIDDDIPLAQFAVAFSGASWTDPDSIALMVLGTRIQAVESTWDCLDDLAYAIMYEISKLFYRVSDADVTRILTYGHRILVAELFARVDAVDASIVKRVANGFIFDQDVAIAAMGPIQGLPDYNWFRRCTYLLRYSLFAIFSQSSECYLPWPFLSW